MKNVFAFRNKITNKYLSGIWPFDSKTHASLSWGENENECHFVGSMDAARSIVDSIPDIQLEIVELKYNDDLEQFELTKG